MMENKRNLRLYKLIGDERITDNLLNIYKELRGKENLKYRHLLRGLVYCSKNPIAQGYLPPTHYFEGFTKKYLEGVYHRMETRVGYRAFGQIIEDSLDKLV